MGIMTLVVLISISLLVLFVFYLIPSNTDVTSTKYEVRFEPANNKYYIVKIANKKESRVLGRFGISTLYYETQLDADFVVQKLNNESSTEVKETKEVK